jgi:NAD(P)-dependent dehydrogenase (short-subunit alcohol dehydrogenase family)
VIAGRVVAVTGAGGSLGPAVVRRLAGGGARLALAGRSREQLAEIADAASARADVSVLDLLDEAATRAWAERTGADALVHLVGGWRGGTAIEEAPSDEWDALADGLVRTTQIVTRAFTPSLLASGRGRFVIVSSTQAQAPTHTNAAYAAAKAAAEAWTLALAHRFRGSGATANIVVVKAIVTAQMRAAEPERDFSTFASDEEIAAAIDYVLGDEAAALNGQRLVLAGGA